MSLPVLEKTWNFQCNQQQAAVADHEVEHREVLFNIISALISLGSNPWTVDYSCDSSSAGTVGDADNKWLTSGNMTWGTGSGSTRSWIVLNRPISGDQLLIDLDSSSAGFYGTRIHLEWSPGGLFTGGAVNARPTATDGIVLIPDTQAWLAGYITSQAYAWHILHSNDGKATYIALCWNNICTQFFAFCDLSDPVSGMTYPIGIIGDNAAGATEWPLYATLTTDGAVRGADNTGTKFDGVISSAEIEGTMTSEGTAGANDFSGLYHLEPCRFGSRNSPARGSHGRFPDLFLGAASLATGDSYPAVGDREFAQFGDLVIPFPNLTPVTA